MTNITPERRYSASPDEAFAAAQRAAEVLGYKVLETDPELRTLSFDTPPRAAFGAEGPVTVEVVADGSGSRVVMQGTLVRSALASRGRLTWSGDGPTPNRYLDALARDLLAPPAGWLDDPSGRFAQRWWNGSDWTALTRDRELSVQYEDPPGSLPPPWSVQARFSQPGQPVHQAPVEPEPTTARFRPLAWRASHSVGA